MEYDKDSDRVEHNIVYGGPLHIRHIFLNIYSNCIKYNKVGDMVETSCCCLGIENGIIKITSKEDNELNAEIAQTLLEDEGAVVTIVHNGQQAIDIFEGNPPGTFDAILMDVMMPVIDGLSATKGIRELDREDAKKIPIIAMTANVFDEDIKCCMEAEMNAHLSKPLEMDKVIETIAKYC